MCLGFLPAWRARSGDDDDRRRLTRRQPALATRRMAMRIGLGSSQAAQRVHPLAPVRQEPRPHRQLVLGQEVERHRLDVPLFVDPLDAVLVGARRVDLLAEGVAVPDQGQVDAGARDQAMGEPRAPARDLGDLQAAVAAVALVLDDAIAAMAHRLEDGDRLARELGIPSALRERRGAESAGILPELASGPDDEWLARLVEVRHAPPQLAVGARHVLLDDEVLVDTEQALEERDEIVRRVRDEQARVEGLPPGVIGLERLDEAGILKPAGELAHVLGARREERLRQREALVHGELVEHLLVEEHLDDGLRRQRDVEVGLEPLAMLRDHGEVEIAGREEDALFVQPAADLLEAIDEAGAAAQEVRAVELCRIPCPGTRLIEVGVDPDHRDAHSSQRATGRHAVLPEAEDDGGGLRYRPSS